MSGSHPERSADRLRVLLAGESWFHQVTHIKGFDTFQTTHYEEGASRFISEMRAAGHQVDYVPAHEVPVRFPQTLAGLQQYDAVILSDVGSNTFLLSADTFARSLPGPNRLALLADYVHRGGGLLMIGGYMSFAGIDGRARFGTSPIGDVLAVETLDCDDRVEVPEGFVAEIVEHTHPVLAGAPGGPWPLLLGYNRVRPRPGMSVLVRRGVDPILAVGSYGAGRSAAFTSDLAPHWAPPEFLDWAGYGPLWDGLLRWLSGSNPGQPASVDTEGIGAAHEREAEPVLPVGSTNPSRP